MTKDELPNVHNLGIRCSVNGVTKQNSTTAQLVFKTEAIVAWVSQFCTLRPGDVILTGTPPGVGVFMKPPEFLQVNSLIDPTATPLFKINFLVFSVETQLCVKLMGLARLAMKFTNPWPGILCNVLNTTFNPAILFSFFDFPLFVFTAPSVHFFKPIRFLSRFDVTSFVYKTNFQIQQGKLRFQFEFWPSVVGRQEKKGLKMAPVLRCRLHNREEAKFGRGKTDVEIVFK